MFPLLGVWARDLVGSLRGGRNVGVVDSCISVLIDNGCATCHMTMVCMCVYVHICAEVHTYCMYTYIVCNIFITNRSREMRKGGRREGGRGRKGRREKEKGEMDPCIWVASHSRWLVKLSCHSALPFEGTTPICYHTHLPSWYHLVKYLHTSLNNENC